MEPFTISEIDYILDALDIVEKKHMNKNIALLTYDQKLTEKKRLTIHLSLLEKLQKAYLQNMTAVEE